MMISMTATHARDKRLQDAIFGASAACQAAIREHGAAAVTNATIGAMMDDEGKLACLPTVERVYKSLPMNDIVAYAPISGLPGYLTAVQEAAFGESRPDGYIAATATAGGTGALRQAVANYAERGSQVLTTDWFWGTYNVICRELGCNLTTFPLFDAKLSFNQGAFAQIVNDILNQQDSLLIILNTPAHNPTGFSLSENDWEGVLATLKQKAACGKKISVLVDIAYIDFAGEKQAARRFMQKFAELPANILVMFAFSMSKGFTFYGQRTGALIALSSSKDVCDEFVEATKYSGRATWSNINRGAMELLTRIYADKTLLTTYEKERDEFYHLVQQRGDIFMTEAKACGLAALPYQGGFFLSVPTKNPQMVCEKLHGDLIFAVPLKLGVRIAACSVPVAKMKGMAAKVKKAWDAVK